VQAIAAYREAAAIVQQLAETIDDEALRGGFLAAEPVRTVLARSPLRTSATRSKEASGDSVAKTSGYTSQ
jgi:hypothetical protein